MKAIQMEGAEKKRIERKIYFAVRGCIKESNKTSKYQPHLKTGNKTRNKQTNLPLYKQNQIIKD